MRRHRGFKSWPEQHYSQGDTGHERAHGIKLRQRACQQRQFIPVVLGHIANRQTQKIPDLQSGNHHRNASGEPQGDRLRNVLDESPQPHQSHDHQQNAGHQGSQQQTTQTIALGDRIENNNEGSRGPGDTEPAATSQCNYKPGNNGGVEPVLWRNTTGNRQRHGQRYGNNAHRYTGHQIP